MPKITSFIFSVTYLYNLISWSMAMAFFSLNLFWRVLSRQIKFSLGITAKIYHSVCFIRISWNMINVYIVLQALPSRFVFPLSSHFTTKCNNLVNHAVLSVFRVFIKHVIVNINILEILQPHNCLLIYRVNSHSLLHCLATLAQIKVSYLE